MISDHDALDLGCAFVDGGDAGIAVEALDFVFLNVAVSAVDLECVVGDAVGGFGGEELGD